jgi:hypothetical protein
MASTPCIIIDMQGIILAWYLSEILTDSRQVSLVGQPNLSRKPDGIQSAWLAVQEKLHPLLKMSASSSSWCDDLSNFHSGEDLKGVATFLPVWFPQGHDVSALAS